MRTRSPALKTKAFSSCLLLIASVLGNVASTSAQSPTVLYACYVPLTGTVYRIRETNLKQTCASTTHVEFNWTDGVRALLGFPLANTPPLTGQVLAFNGSAWEPIAVSVGGGDQTQFLLTNGVRNSTGGFAVTGSLNLATQTPVSGAGIRMMWFPERAAFRAGIIDGTQWDAANIGQFSAALGQNVLASGFGAVAFGSSTAATGSFATALGAGSSAEGAESIAVGHFARSLGIGSVAGGWNTVAGEFASTAFGNFTNASGSASTALGHDTRAIGDYATAMGVHTEASGEAATALGSRTRATGIASIATGSNSLASGFASTAMGDFAEARETGSVALGGFISVTGRGSFAFGDQSTTTVQAFGNPNMFSVRAAGGAIFYSNANLQSGVHLAPGGGAWQAFSDVNGKRLFRDESAEATLSKIAAMRIQSWSYKTQDPSIRHMGPTAQDFHAAFGLGESNLTITTTDIDGVALLAIQALEKRTRTLQTENSALRNELSDLRARFEQLERMLQR